MKQILPFTLLLSTFPALSCADAIGVQAGAASWSYDISGSVRYKTEDSANDIDVNDDLGYDDDSLGFIYVMIDHPLPLIPNVKISRTNIDTDADGRLSQTVTYGNVTFNANEDVSSEVQLDQTDITLYYRILDNVANLDLGLNAKYIDAESTITGATSGTESADISGWVPMLYAGVGIDLPFTGLSVSADGSAIGYQDSTFYDYSVRASYTTPWHLGVDVGYRAVKLDLDDFDDSFADVEFDGPYAGAYLKF
ncbi:MAG: TIGR04219 family outer membrane beta-barrel protein [Thiogranum sp.]|nr:TIGR04219 family outer membrane beta-barrel protein [Thiogranum sp.]